MANLTHATDDLNPFVSQYLVCNTFEMETNDPTNRMDAAVCLAVYGAANATLQLYRDLLAPWGLTFQQLMVLGVLQEAGETTPGGIADALMVDSSSVTGLLNRMERAGMIERDVDRADRRRVLVRSTSHARETLGRLGWIEDCLAEAVALDDDAARDLVTRLHALRDTVSAFTRPETAATYG